MNENDQRQPEVPTHVTEPELKTEHIPAPSVSVASASPQPVQSKFAMIRRVTASVTITSAILFALISILAIWEVFGQNTGDVVWRSASSLAVIGFASLIVNVVARSMEERR